MQVTASKIAQAATHANSPLQLLAAKIGKVSAGPYKVGDLERYFSNAGMKTDKIESLRYRGFDTQRRSHVYVAVQQKDDEFAAARADIALGKEGFIEAILSAPAETFDTLPLAENYALKVDLTKL